MPSAPISRVAAIRADKRTGRGVDEVRRHPFVVLLEMRKAMPGPYGRRVHPHLHGAGQDHHQAAAVD